MEDKGSFYYKLQIPDDYDQKSDAIITISPSDARSDPDLHISSTNQKPSNLQDSEFSWAVVGEDIWTIPSSQISAGKIFYIAAKWYKKCNYKISASLNTEIELKARKDYSIPFKAGEKKLFNFNNLSTSVKEILFTARADRSTASIRMFLKDGKDAVPTSTDMRANEGWQDGIVIRLTNSTMIKPADGQIYKLLFEAEDSAMVTFRIDLLFSEKLIIENEIIEDYVNYNDRTWYKYIVKSTDKNLRVGVYSFSGNPDIYVNPDSNLQKLSDFKFKATEKSDDVIVITPEDRTQAGYKKGLYFICIFAGSNTSYRMKVTEADKDFYLEDGIAETNEVKSGTEMMYYYTDSSLVRNLNITFTLSSKSGPKPNMYIKFWGKVSEENCKFTSSDNGVYKATNEIGTLIASIKHDGIVCRGKVADQDLNCIYGVLVKAPFSLFTETSHFALSASHNETSHIKLREGIPLDQIVENHQTKYFEFVVRDSETTEVTFTLNSHHGDADIYASRIEKYPDINNNEMKSTRSRRFADEVTFVKEKDKSLIGVYYLAVQGFEYSTYTIRASINRGEDLTKVIPVQITEGVMLNDAINNANTKKYYQFKSRMFGTGITDIKISVTPVAGKVKFYAKLSELPTPSNYDYLSVEGSDIFIKTTDKKFDPLGNYYILVVPEIISETEFSPCKFSIKYSTSRSITELQKDLPVFGTVNVQKYDNYKFTYIEAKGADVTISLTPLSGNPNLLVSIDPQKSFPTIQNYDFHSKKDGKDSIFISGDKLFSTNPSCNPFQQPLLGAKPCEIFIVVYCGDQANTSQASTTDFCSYSLKVYTGNNLPHMIIDGMPQKDTVKDRKWMYYFMEIDPNHDYLHAVATAQVGTVGMYVSFVDQAKSKQSNDLLMPTDTEHMKKSKTVGHSEIIHFSKKEIKKEWEQIKECLMIIGVRGEESIDLIEYTLIAYTKLPRVTSNSPISARIDKNTFSYFVYRSLCESCSIIVSASSYSVDTDIDMYINVGYKNSLPTNDNYDIKSNHWFSEVVEISLDHEYFRKNKIESMKGIYIIGIYAKEDTTISLEIEDTPLQIKQLRSGKGVQVDQEPNKQRIFKYVHNRHKNLKYELTMLSGSVTMRINRFMEYLDDSPMRKFFPIDDKTSIWKTYSDQNSTILINTDDHNFCSKWTYLVNIESNLKGAKYTLEVQEEDISTPKLIKMGVPIKDQIENDDYKGYMFVLDKKKKFKISASVYLGKITYSVGNSKDFKSSIAETTSNSLEIDGSKLDEFSAGENVYIKVKGEFEHSEFILQVTHHGSYTIIPDSFTQEFTINPYDREGVNFIYYPPNIQLKLKMQVNSLMNGVIYDVYSKKIFTQQIIDDNLNFPKEGEAEFGAVIWDKDKRSALKFIEQNPERDDQYIFLFTVIPKIVDNSAIKETKTAKFTVNINANIVSILSPNIPTEDYLTSDNKQYKIYKFFANGNKDIDIIITPCVCDVEAFVYKTLEEAHESVNPINRSKQFINGNKEINIKSAQGPYFVRLQLSSINDHQEYLKTTSNCIYNVEYRDRSNYNYQFSLNQYNPGNNGLISYKWSSSKKLNLEWQQIQKQTSSGTISHPTYSSVYLLKKPNLFMNSVCGIKHAINRDEAELIESGIEGNSVEIKPKEHSFMKNNQYASFVVIASINREGGAIPYQQVTIYIAKPWWSLIPTIIYFVVMMMCTGFCISVWVLIYYRTKNKIMRSKLDFEMNDIRNVARVTYTDANIESMSLKKKQATSGIMDESNV